MSYFCFILFQHKSVEGNFTILIKLISSKHLGILVFQTSIEMKEKHRISREDFTLSTRLIKLKLFFIQKNKSDLIHKFFF